MVKYMLILSLITYTLLKKKLQKLLKQYKKHAQNLSLLAQLSKERKMSRSLMVDFILFSLFIFILLFFSFLFHFSIFRTTRVRVHQSCCHISHKLMA